MVEFSLRPRRRESSSSFFPAHPQLRSIAPRNFHFTYTNRFLPATSLAAMACTVSLRESFAKAKKKQILLLRRRLNSKSWRNCFSVAAPPVFSQPGLQERLSFPSQRASDTTRASENHKKRALNERARQENRRSGRRCTPLSLSQLLPSLTLSSLLSLCPPFSLL